MTQVSPVRRAGMSVLCLCVLLFLLYNSLGHLASLFWGEQIPAVPFTLSDRGYVDSAGKDLAAAGISKGDIITAIDGQPASGWYGMYRQLRGGRLGETVVVQALHNGQPVTATIPRRPQHTGPHASTSLLVFAVGIQDLFPLVCVAIGIWVLFSRPQDPAAWWVFGILQFVPAFFSIGDTFPGPLQDFARVWNQLSTAYLSVSAAMLGLTFPEPTRLERRWPWLKRLLVSVVACLASLDVVMSLLKEHNLALMRAVPGPAVAFEDGIDQLSTIVCVSLLCAGICMNYFSAQSADARRRLRVLLIGSQVGLWPSFLMVLAATAVGKQPNELLPLPLFVVVLLLFMLFPLSLAYSIVVERAMSIRILVRQGTRYALARGTLIALQIALGFGLAFSIKRLVDHEQHATLERVALVVMILLFVFLRGRGAKQARDWVDRRFFREQYSTELLLSELVREAGRFTETQPLLDTMTRRISETLHVDKIAVLLRDGHSFQLRCATGFDMANGFDGPGGFLLAENSEAVEELEADQRPATVYFDRPDDWLVRASEAERTALRAMQAEVLLPLPGRQRLMGVMALGPKRSEQPYSSTDLQLLTSVGAQTGLAVENSNLIASLAHEAAQRERIHREIEIAREVQQRLFPQSFPHLPGVCITGHCRPALAVGGDYYDCMLMPSEDGGVRIGIAIGDISGKGISAALLMASLRASLRGQTLTGSRDVAQMMRNVNTLLYEASDTNRYATFFFAVYEPSTFRLVYVNGGHNAPAVLRRDAAGPGGWKVFRLEEGGPVVGLIPGVGYVQQELQMQPGDLFVSFTDGISEAMDPEDEEWGEERLLAEAMHSAAMPAEQLCTHLFAAADAFAAGAPQHDDMTVVLMQLA